MASPSLAFLGGLLLGGISIGFLRGPWLLFLFGLPGILAHELAHYLIAVLTRSSPSLPRLMPSKEGKTRWTLGSVTFEPGILSGGMVALAPLYVLPPIAVLTWMLAPTFSPLGQSLLGYSMGWLVWGAFPSRTDWWIALRYPLGSLLVLAPAGAYLVWKFKLFGDFLA